MRFSLKWLMAGMAYVALAAAAFGTAHWAYADALWAVAFSAVVYSAIVAILARGCRQYVTVGFVLACLWLTVQQQIAGSSVPTAHFFTAIVLSTSEPIDSKEYAARRRAANSLATMLAGLVGGVLGAVAWRRRDVRGD